MWCMNTLLLRRTIYLHRQTVLLSTDYFKILSAIMIGLKKLQVFVFFNFNFFLIFHTTSIKIRIVDPDRSLSLSREGNAYCHTFSELDVYIIWICDLNFNNQALKRF